MAVYVIGTINIHDRATYTKYASGFREIFAPYGGKILSVDEAPKVLEGEWRCTRTVLLEFPTQEQALAWYHSPEYQELVRYRHAASAAQVVLVQGR
jgi:uncharacterized protein (DUF1330 family)